MNIYLLRDVIVYICQENKTKNGGKTMTQYKRFHHMRAHYTDEWSDDKRHRIQEFFSYNTKIARLTTNYICTDCGVSVPVYTLDIGYYFDRSKNTEKQLYRWLDEVLDCSGFSYEYLTDIISHCDHYTTDVFSIFFFNVLINVELYIGAIKYNGKSTFINDYYIDELHDYGL